MKYFHVFGSKCYILEDREQRRKMDPKSEEGIFLGYSTKSRTYRVYNSRTKIMMESVNVVIDDAPEEHVFHYDDDENDQPFKGSDGVVNATQDSNVPAHVPDI